MSDIELVIKIPEDVFKRTVFYREFRDLNDCVTTIKALEKAVSLPKGHGRLIDADAYIATQHEGGNPDFIMAMTVEEFNNATPTIIKASEVAD